MAPSTRRRAVTAPSSTEEWSCALCTLLNHWEDERCAACDQERPPATQAAAQTPVDPTPTQQTSQYGQLVGVFFKAATPSTAWRNEPRLRVNRRKRPLQQQTSGRSDPPRMMTPFASVHEPTRRLLSVANDRAATRAGDYSTAETPRFDPPRISAATASDDRFKREDTTQARPSAANAQDTQHTCDSVMAEAPSFSLLQPDSPHTSTSIPSNEEVERQIENENTPDERDPPMVEAPSFSLLGSMDFATTTATEQENTYDTQEHGADDAVPSMPSFSLLGNLASEIAPASAPKLVSTRAENVDSQAKMAQAGLDLSDSDNDAVAPRPLQRRKNRVSTTPPTEPDQQATWECPTCTHLNAKSSSRCELCEQGPGVWECSICTHCNARTSTRCELCESRDDQATWECSTCTHLNAKSSSRCEVCGPGEEDQATWECPICTNYNAGSLTRCELCDTPRERVATRAATSRVYQPETIDLATSQYDDEVQTTGRKHQESFYDDYDDEEEEYDPNDDEAKDDDEDFETIYGYNDPDIGSEPENYPQSRSRGARDYDRVEDISDNEAPTPFEPPRRVRPELEAFQHFTSVEDVAGDYGCKVDYRGMFADSSRGKSYGERLQKRKRESQKRKREAAQREQQFGSLPGFESARTLKESRAKKSKKAASGKASRSKKAKATPTARRASTSRVAAAKRATKAKGGGSSTARRSSAPAYQSTVNHYDLSGADFGEDVSTMAWEGVGSAGYY
ncbi:hypothetical protein Poli38472_009853 [Pythium oligandrum]|uniref:RanBP2-type domain-containing protein n=1 Tax=Pythium oligandrum TaxID=41045 RepID=A0A8K1CGL8_PYTOL|nr:hypothetical protein Poli38472_009853 [Pythium oligandrum]|eukprot:TMW62360.1 hypothetical protein Poli38472_009853 [Pythium oligandrum]